MKANLSLRDAVKGVGLSFIWQILSRKQVSTQQESQFSSNYPTLHAACQAGFSPRATASHRSQHLLVAATNRRLHELVCHL